MKQYLVVTKGKSYLIDADIYGIVEVTDKRQSVYQFFRKGKDGKVDLVATFNLREVKAIIEQ